MLCAIYCAMPDSHMQVSIMCKSLAAFDDDQMYVISTVRMCVCFSIGALHLNGQKAGNVQDPHIWVW